MTSKESLLNYANENPGQFLLVCIVNGEMKCESSWSSPGDATMMLFMAEQIVKDTIREKIGIKPRTLQNQ